MAGVNQSGFAGRTVAIVGVGLMGGSLGLAVQARAGVRRVVGCSRTPETLEEALQLGAITEAAGSLEEAVAEADLAFVCTPVRDVAGHVRQAYAAARLGCVVTDVGSTKTALMESLSWEQQATCIGGHPLCGAETAGVGNARASLYEGAVYFLTPGAHVRHDAFQLLYDFVSAIGARPVTIDAVEHDRLMALVSHLPHVLANVLMSQAGGREGGRDALLSTGPSFRDLTRIAGANRRVWTDIFLENRAALLEALRAFQVGLEEVEGALEAADADGLSEQIAAAAAHRQRMLVDSSRVPESSFRLEVQVPDRPGVLKEIMTALGDEAINVEDLSLHHMSAELGGTLTVYVSGEHGQGRGVSRGAGVTPVSDTVAFPPSGPLRGTVRVPSDKSITQRALLIGAVSDGVVEVREPLWAGDTEATADMLAHVGVRVEREAGGHLARVHGVGLRGLRQPAGTLDARNSGTAMRLLAGLLAGQRGTFTLDGDQSLRRRPMARIVEPLAAMGVSVGTAEGGRPPLSVDGGEVRAITYELPVASAQVKSCVMLAGLFADGETCVIERVPSRDHTERMLAAAGVPIAVYELRGESPGDADGDGAGGRRIALRGPAQPHLRAVDVPGDPSSAAFLVAAAVVVPGSELVFERLGLNPTRLGFFEVLRRMGALVEWRVERESGGEPVGRLKAVATGRLAAATVSAREVPLLVDELPLVGLVAAFAEGETVVSGAGELRVKESDRLAATVGLLAGLGVDVSGTDDGFVVRGGSGLRGGAVESRGDHRLALLGAVAGLAADAPVTVTGFDAADVSFPGLLDLLAEVSAPWR